MQEGYGRVWDLEIGKPYSVVATLNAHLVWEARRLRKTQYSMAGEVSEENKDFIRNWVNGHSGSILAISLASSVQCPVDAWDVNFLGG